ncbi:diguanylate cyclase, partial [Massilia aurea]
MQENRATTTQQDTITLGWTLFEAIPDCVKLLGMDGLVLAINRNGLLSMEIDDIETVRGKPWTAYWPQPSHAVVDAALDAARAGGTGHFSAACATVKGRPKWWDVMITRTAASDGQETRLLVISRDITEQVRLDAERKEAERALHASRERFEKIVSQAATGVVQMDTAGHIVLANQKYCAMVGRSEAELLGLSVAEVTAPQSRAQTHDALERLKAGATGVALDKYYLHRDGSLVSATSSVNALRGPDGEFEGLVAIVLDTTESKQVQERLRASEERYRTLFESVDQGFCIFEMIFDDAGKAVDYRFLEMNPMFERHTGLVDAVGRTAREMLPALDDFWFETYGRVALTGIPTRFENEAPAMGRWFDVYANRIGGPDSRKVALLFSEITARKRSEEELRRLADDLAEADRRKTEFLATLAHELRNPLA